MYRYSSYIFYCTGIAVTYSSVQVQKLYILVYRYRSYILVYRYSSHIFYSVQVQQIYSCMGTVAINKLRARLKH